MVLFNFLVLLVCVCCFLLCRCFWLSLLILFFLHFLLISLHFLLSLPIRLLLSAYYISSCSCYYSCYPTPADFPPPVSPSLNHLCYFSDCCFLLVLVVFGSYSACFSSLVSFLRPSPPLARACTWKKKNEYRILFAFVYGFLCRHFLSFFFVVSLLWISFVHKACLFHFLRLSFNRVDISLFFLICRHFVVCSFGKNLLSVHSSLVSGLFGLVILSVRSLLILSASAFVAFYCSDLFLVGYLRHLGSFFFAVLLSCRFFYFISWLLSYPSGFSGVLFDGNPLGGRLGIRMEGANISSAFSRRRGCGLKHSTSPRRKVFCYLVGCRRYVFGVETGLLSRRVSQTMLPKLVFQKKQMRDQSDPPSYVFTF